MPSIRASRIDWDEGNSSADPHPPTRYHSGAVHTPSSRCESATSSRTGRSRASSGHPPRAAPAPRSGSRLLAERALAELGGVDLLVNNVGEGDAVEPVGFLEVGDDQWREVFDLNPLSAVRVSRALLPNPVERRGAMVNVSSINSRLPATGPVAYSTAKAALTALGKAPAEEFGPLGVRVNTVSPGAVRTAIREDPDGFGGKVAAAAGVDHASFLRRLPRAFGITSRITEPAEVASLITFPLSDVAANVTGADHVIDGGTVKAL